MRRSGYRLLIPKLRDLRGIATPDRYTYVGVYFIMLAKIYTNRPRPFPYTDLAVYFLMPLLFTPFTLTSITKNKNDAGGLSINASEEIFRFWR